MTTQFHDLIDQARGGDADRQQALLRALQSSAAPAAVLIELARSDLAALRKIAITAARDRSEPELIRALAELARDADREVRLCLASSLRTWSESPLHGVLEKLLYDEDDDVRRHAAEAARGKESLDFALIGRLSQDRDWRVRQAVAESLTHSDPRSALPALLGALGEEGDRDVAEACARAAEKHLRTLGGYPAELPRPRFALLEAAHLRLAGYRQGAYPLLAGWLHERVLHDVDLDQLATFGRPLTVEIDAGRLPRAHGVENICAAAQSLLTGTAPRAVVLLGEPGAGKTAVVHELAHRLRHDPAGAWHLLRVAPSDILAGTTWLGEWQTKVKNLVQAIRAPRRVILYIPNLEELSEAGRSAQSESNVATALAPSIERGEIAVLGESTPEAFRTGLGGIASLRRLFHPVQVPDAGPEQTKAILRQVVSEARTEVAEPVLDRLIELAGFYLAGTAEPGRTVGLLRRVLSSTAGRSEGISSRDVLSTLSTATGIPVDFLDDAVPLDRAAVRGFFEARVMGQPEAVEAVVDLVTLVKAGLTDPGKPFGVMLFVGPTGVGKTELARSLAELLFGDAGRLIRLDMSEFSTFEAHERLIGGSSSRPGLLTSAVRERPFSVVLLDEIEKAHPNVFDLCLQIFDAGRLTDQHGRTADFRRTIIILTSNIGSAARLDAPLGFKAEARETLDQDSTLREVQRWFRPEFLNRLDRIVMFRPLAEETAEKIARREVARVLERSGLKRRRLDVEVAPAVLSLLLREGYSPAFGARPLKRTVERLVLLPVAQAIAAGAVPPGSLLRLVARGSQVAVDVAAPETDGEAPPQDRGERAGTESLKERLDRLREQLAQLERDAEPVAARKSELVARTAAADFWNDPQAARAVQDEIFRLDGVLGAYEQLARAVGGEREPAAGLRGPRQLAAAQERLAGLERQLRHVALLLRCNLRELGDAYVSLTLVSARGAGLAAVEKLAGMYQAFAVRSKFEVQVLDDHCGGTPPEDAITLLVSGPGALGLLRGEAGLHQVSRGKEKGRSGKARAIDRDLVRVEVLPLPDRALPDDEIRCEIQALRSAKGRLLPKPRFEAHLLHVPTMTALRAWTDGPKSQALEQMRALLAARVEAGKQTQSPPEVIRRYVLGPAPLVRDLRSGRSTGRLEKVLQGWIDEFLVL